jgi:UDP-galactopyranose mutase
MIFSTVPMFEQKRDARCFVDGQLIPYPFQKNFHFLDEAVKIECEAGLRESSSGQDARNYAEFIRSKFGSGISDKFMLPYNKKLWGANLERLSCDWVHERVASPKGEKEAIMINGNRAPLTEDQIVAYPETGGFEEIFLTLAQRLPNISLADQVVRIDAKSKVLYRTGGMPIKYQNIISTIPLPQLLKCIDGIPSDVLLDVEKGLDALAMKIVFLVVNYPVNTNIQRIYVADPDVPFHKLVVNHNSSNYLRALPNQGLIAEVSLTPEMKLTDEELKEAVISSLLHLNLITSKSDVSHAEIMHLKYGYPVPTHKREKIITRIRDWLAERKIFLVGRFSEWAYINSDEAMYRGIRLATDLNKF